MKKFLSLVLVLVMTMSLVTISAGATEYKELTDKDEIQYEEAVAVLNRIGIITGYEDGSFRPETELTRGAAAKIIVSLMIGPDAASALPNNQSPYPDVPAGHTFAGVIGYCKTAGYISGYGDGTFKPANSLTGYAFAKMLLGALGYKGDYEGGFTGTGWTMNVARVGNAAGLFNRLSFQGADAVNREEACQLALNTLKATMVEYTGGFSVTAGDASVVGAQTRTYVTSNQSYAKNIDNRKAKDEGNSKDVHYTVEFGEEHFKDLRLNDEHEEARDSFGRPSNEWSYKKVTIGTFPIAADFVFDKQMAHLDKTDAVKNRATGLGGYKLSDGESSPKYTSFWVNGKEYALTSDNWSSVPQTNNTAEIKSGEKAKVANISDLTDNGTIVEVYVSEDTADFITDVVVIQTQLMEVRRVGSDYVSLQKEGNKDVDAGDNNAYNMKAIDVSVEDVKAEDGAYSVVSELKAGDIVAVIPVAQDSDPAGSNKYDVSEAYIPETVSGALTAVETYGTIATSAKDPVEVTVGGTKYPVALWSRDLLGVDADAVKLTRKDVTLHLDKNGNALKIEDVGSVDGWMVIGRYYEDVVDRHLVTMVEGWDSGGEKLELNLGNFRNNWEGRGYAKGYAPGDLVRYESITSGNAEWRIIPNQGNKNIVVPIATEDLQDDRIQANDVQIPLTIGGAAKNVYVDSTGIKFIYVTYDTSGEVDSVQIKKGVQEATKSELQDYYDKQTEPVEADSDYTSAQAGYTVKDGNPSQIKVVVLKSEANDAVASNMLYIRDQVGGAEKLADGTMVYKYTAAMMGPDGLIGENETIYSDDRIPEDSFAAYYEKEVEGYSKFYDLRAHNNFTGRVTSTFQASLGAIVNADEGLIHIVDTAKVKGTRSDSSVLGTIEVLGDPRHEVGGMDGVLRTKNAVWVDLRPNDVKFADGNREINTIKDLKWLFSSSSEKLDADGDGYLGTGEETLVFQLIVNDNPDNRNFREVAMVVITAQGDVVTPDKAPDSHDANLVSLSIGGTPIAFTQPDRDVAEFVATYEFETGADPAAVAATISAKATASATGATITFTGTSGTGTLTLTDGAELEIVVTAEDGTTSKTYTVTLKEDTGLFNWSGLTSDMSDAVAALADQDLDGDIANLKFLNDGTAATMEQQALEGLKELGIDVDEDSVELLSNGKIAYSYTTPKGNVLTADFTPDIAAVKFTVDGDVAYDAAEQTLDQILTGLTAIPSITEIGEDEAPITADDLSTLTVVAGAAYKTEVYTKVNVVDGVDTAAAIGTSTGSYTYTVEADEDVIEVDNNWYMKAGQQVVVTVTLDDVANASTTLSGKTDTISIDGATGLDVAPATATFDQTTTADNAVAAFTITAPETAKAAVDSMAVKGVTA
nr:S-layer homology domain-containing protein [uncultured Oscillibacter sp.]